ncbi:MAG: hypothetical protein E7222_09655 [Clostridiales bacterium]|nr:hypothetical protein [Clostridiales bacterium]
MLNIQIIQDQTKLAKQIEALELTLEEDDLTTKDRQIFTQTLKSLKKELTKEKENENMVEFQTISSLNEVLNELTDQTKCKIKFTKNDIKLLHNKITTEDDLKEFTCWFNVFKDFYTPRLITRTYMFYSQEKYGQTVSRIIEIYNKLVKYHVANPFNRMYDKTLFELQDLIKDENDWDMFYQVWQKMKNDYEFGHILFEFKQSKKIGQVA